VDTINITKSTPLNKVLEIGKECKQCGKCCTFGSGFILESELQPIADELNMTKKEFMEKFLETTDIFNTKLFKIKPKSKKGKPLQDWQLHRERR
jgi:Fe-S-cluster containining protein